VFGKQISTDYHQQDRYGWTLSKVLVDGLDSNLAQVNAGLA
jgi:endonuclease YncB( thermonuclease family)